MEVDACAKCNAVGYTDRGLFSTYRLRSGRNSHTKRRTLRGEQSASTTNDTSIDNARLRMPRAWGE